MCVNTHRKQNTPSPHETPNKNQTKKIPMEFALCWRATAGHAA